MKTENLVIIILLFAGGLYLSYRLLKSKSSIKKEDTSKDYEKKREIESKQDFIYLSQLKPILEEYNLTYDNFENFFKLIELLISEGENYVFNRISNILKGSEPDIEKAKQLVNEYTELEKNFKNKNFHLVDPSDKSVKIYVESIKLWLEELGISEKDARKNLPLMMPLILEKIYNKAKNDKLNYFFKKNIEALKKYIEEGDEQGITNELLRIKRKLD